MKKILEVFLGLRPIMLMLLVQVIYTVMNIFYKMVDSNGMNLRILVVYRWTVAAAFTIPLALFLERNKVRPNFTWRLLGFAFLSGLFGGALSQNLYLQSLTVTSATFAAAITNLSPAITLILSVSFRYEKLRLTTTIGKAKVLGTLIGIAGGMVMTFYRGVEVNIWSTNVNLLKSHTSLQNHHHVSPNYILGFVYAFSSCAFYASWLIIQVEMSKIYPLHYTNATLTSLMAAIQCVIFSVCTERNWSEWKLGWNIRLLTVVYSGTINSGLVLIFIAWCVRVRGAVFVSSFSPVSLILIAVVASLFLQEKLHLGCILGGALIVGGLYIVIWGQQMELKELKATQNQNQDEDENQNEDELIEISVD